MTKIFTFMQKQHFSKGQNDYHLSNQIGSNYFWDSNKVICIFSVFWGVLSSLGQLPTPAPNHESQHCIYITVKVIMEIWMINISILINIYKINTSIIKSCMCQVISDLSLKILVEVNPKSDLNLKENSYWPATQCHFTSNINLRFYITN